MHYFRLFNRMVFNWEIEGTDEWIIFRSNLVSILKKDSYENIISNCILLSRTTKNDIVGNHIDLTVYSKNNATIYQRTFV